MKARHTTRLFGLSGLVLLVAFTQMVTMSAQERRIVNVLRKTGDAGQRNEIKSGRRIVTIRLNGLRSNDFVNIRPSDETGISVAAGSLKGAYDPGRGITPGSGLIRPGESLPDNSLDISDGTVTFNRLSILENIVFLDIQIPKRSVARVFADERELLNASLRQPLSLRGQEWGQGEMNPSRVLVRAAGFPSENLHAANSIFYDRSSGRYIVPSSQLETLRKRPLRGEAGTSIVVRMDIDETGHVVGVSPLTNQELGDVQRTLMKWRFAPYRIEGRPVAVTTFLCLKVE